MSITLTAYPIAFLIDPKLSKNNKLKLAKNEVNVNKEIATKNLKSIRVLTNIRHDELSKFMSNLNCDKINPLLYRLKTGLHIEWEHHGKYMIAKLYGDISSQMLQVEGEKFFKDMDGFASRNVRAINSNEYFYYDYETTYTNIPEIYSVLKSQGATEIFPTDDNGVVATVKGQSVKYFKNDNEDTYTLRTEQKIAIMNIGLSGEYEGTNITYGLSDLKIQTNITQSELKTFLKKANYLLYQADMQTPLKSSYATLNWILKDGYYVAQFSGTNNAAITKEAEIIFRKMNIAAGRDLRYINETSTTVYTYTTNYTDREILINTLTEHGAQEIEQNKDEVSCKLFGMEMVYYKKENSQGYTLDITRISNINECENLINDLNDEYGLNIQEMTYNKIKTKLDEANMRIMSETVEEDNSIVLTIEI